MPTRITDSVAAPQTENNTVVDEWGIYDPAKAGLEAVYQRLAAAGALSEEQANRLAAALERAVKQLRKRKRRPRAKTTL
jgi:hypothetical protein